MKAEDRETIIYIAGVYSALSSLSIFRNEGAFVLPNKITHLEQELKAIYGNDTVRELIKQLYDDTLFDLNKKRKEFS